MNFNNVWRSRPIGPLGILVTYTADGFRSSANVAVSSGRRGLLLLGRAAKPALDRAFAKYDDLARSVLCVPADGLLSIVGAGSGSCLPGVDIFPYIS